MNLKLPLAQSGLGHLLAVLAFMTLKDLLNVNSFWTFITWIFLIYNRF